jgi:hypothetical protein
MLMGVIASSGSSRTNATPPTPDAIMDFATDTYSVSGASVAASDMISRPDLISGGQLSVGVSGSNVAPAIVSSDIQAILNSGSFAVLFDIETEEVADPDNASHYTNELLEVAEWYSGASISIYGAAHFGWELDDLGFTSRFSWDYANGLTVGRHKIAMLRTNSKARVAVDGNVFDDGGSSGQQSNDTCVLPDSRLSMGHPPPDDSISAMTEFNNFHLGGGYAWDNSASYRVNGDGYVGTNITPLHFNSVKFYNLSTPISDSALRAMTT